MGPHSLDSVSNITTVHASLGFALHFLASEACKQATGGSGCLEAPGFLGLGGGVIEGRDTHRGQATRTPLRGSGRSSLCRGATWDKYMFVLIN